MAGQLFNAVANNFSVTSDAYVVTGDKTQYLRDLLFLSIIGGQSAVKAVSAAVLKRSPDAVSLSPLHEDDHLQRVRDFLQDNPAPAAKRLAAIRRADSGKWRSRTTRLPATRAWHTIIYSTLLEYDQEGKRFVLLAEPGSEDASLRHLQFLSRRVSIPLYPTWKDWLWERAITSGEISELDAVGVKAWGCYPDEAALKIDIGICVRAGTLTVPEGRNGKARIFS